MGNIVHARKSNGNYEYRVYNTTSDTYISPSLTDREISLFLLYDGAFDEGITKAIASQMTLRLAISQRLKRAREGGTSQENQKRDLTKFDNVRDEYWGNKYKKEKTKKSFIEDILERMKTPLYILIKEELGYWQITGKKQFPEASDALKSLKDLLDAEL